MLLLAWYPPAAGGLAVDSLADNDIGFWQARIGTQCQVHFENRSRIENALDIAFIIEVQVGAVNCEPDIGQPFLIGGHRERVYRTGGLI